MSATLPLFDQIFSGPKAPVRKPLTGRELRDFGIDDALARAERVKGEYVAKCIDAIKSFPTGTLITSEDIREKAGEPPVSVDRSVMAGILKKAASAQLKLIVITEYTRNAQRVTVHAKKLSCWRRL
jgi:hypothetical protein